MALLDEINGLYIRIENIRLGKNVMQFEIKKYINVEDSHIEISLLTIPYDIEGSNPFAQAYEYLKSHEDHKDFKSDIELEPIKIKKTRKKVKC